MIEFFYRTHDPTTVNRQGGDTGTRESGNRFSSSISILRYLLEYRSAIFFNTPEQKDIAQRVTEEIQKKYFDPKGVLTSLILLSTIFRQLIRGQVRRLFRRLLRQDLGGTRRSIIKNIFTRTRPVTSAPRISCTGNNEDFNCNGSEVILCIFVYDPRKMSTSQKRHEKMPFL